MSLSEIIREQQSIVAEQQDARAEFQKMKQRLESLVQTEMRKISARLEATNARIERLLGGSEGSMAVGVQGSQDPKGLPLFSKGPAPAYANSQSSPQQRAAIAGQRPRTAQQSPRPDVPRPASGVPMSAKSMPQMQPQRRSLAEGRGGLEEKKEILANAKENVQEHIWSEPKDGKPTPAVLDHAEETLRRSFTKTKECQRCPHNPPQGMSAIFRRADQNHSGKVDKSEFSKVCTMLDFHTNPEIIGGLFNRYDLDRSGLISVDEMGRMLFKVDGDKAAKAMSAIARMREVLALRAGGFETMRAMGSQFRIMDRDKTGQLSKEEFNTALDILFSGYNLKFTPAEKVSLFQQFDYDKSGLVDYNEFTRGIRGDMNDFRMDWVRQAFGLLDKDRSGVVSTAEMGQTYDVSQNPAVKSGKVHPDDALRLFMQHFDANSDGTITFEEFAENYQWVSASIDDDDYFELMMRNAWHITGGEGWCANTSNLRVLVKHLNAPDEVVCVENDLGLPRDPALKTQEVVKRLKAQGVKDIQKIEFCG
eukprot:TRINITY_DN24661_c0_g2_i1.p1 TRINITY_DN24661_c0_g2~~TRINITY_DN24661_c0_g2_i1.p1  ORF type:complete len:535 (-),score=113.92 TRINITY_DN24661_c0_g2_i1:65-1669(-)